MRHWQLKPKAVGEPIYVMTRGQRRPGESGYDEALFDIEELARQPGEDDEVVGGRVVKNKDRAARREEALKLNSMSRAEFREAIMADVAAMIADKSQAKE